MAINRTKILAAADKYFAGRKFDKALNEYLKLVKITPNDVNLLNKVGDLYSKLGNKKNAISYFERVGQSYHKSGFFPKAIAVYKKINRLDPDYMESREKLVELYAQQGLHSEAKAELRTMADHYVQSNLPGRALDVYEKLVQLDPNNLDARIKLAEILIREGKNEEAAQHFMSMGRDLIDKNMLSEARKILTKAAKINPDNVQIQVLLSRAMIAEGKLEEGIRFLTELCESNPNDLEAVVTLGEAYLSRDMVTQAKTCFLRAVHIDPSHVRPLEEVASLFIEKKQLDEAFEAIEPISDYMLSKGNPEEATRLYRSILYVDDRHIPSMERMIRIYQKSGQTPNAILTLEKIINHHVEEGHLDLAKQAVQRLLELDPDNLEWRDKLELLARGATEFRTSESSTNASMEMDKTDLVVDDSIEASVFAVEGPDDSSIEPDDPATLIANHLTEAEVFVKYGILDQALEHLLAVIDLDPNHYDGNLKLKQIYLERGDIDKAVACLTNLVSIAIETGKLAEAEEFITEAETHKPGVARLYRGQLESIKSKELSEQAEDRSQAGFDIEFNEAEAARDQLDFGKMGEEDVEVVDFKNLNAKDAAGLDLDMLDEKSDMDWGLDIPGVTQGEAEPQAPDEPAEAKVMHDVSDLAFDFDMEAPEEPEDMDHLEPDVVEEEELEEPTVAPDERLFDIPIDDTEILADLDDEDVDADDIPVVLEETPESASDGLVEEAEPDFEEIEIPDSAEDEAALPTEPEPEPLVEEPLAEEMEDDSISFVEEEELDLESIDEEVMEEPTPAPDGPPELSSKAREAMDGEIEEIDFFISMEAFDDASNLVLEALERFGKQPELVARKAEIDKVSEPAIQAEMTPQEEDRQRQLAREKTLIEEGTGFFDLAAELQEELFEDAAEITDNATQEEIQSVEELFEEFKKGVAEQIDESDYETHYDLGIAYKEMGLLEESIEEFRVAQKDTRRFLECTAMIGACLIEMGRTEEAISHYQKSLDTPGGTQAEYHAIRYELGRAYEGFGELEKALDLYHEIEKDDPKYRDIPARIAALI